MLNNFSSFFEIFAGLNLAYAGSNGFRSAIDDEILKINNTHSYITERIEQTKSKIFVTVSEEYEEVIANKALKIEEEYKLKSTAILDNERKNVEFTEGFKSMFLASALYSISIILLGGYEQFIMTDSKIINLFLLLLFPIFLFNLFVFYRSFTNDRNKKIRPLITISFVLMLFVISFLILIYCPYQYDIENSFTDVTCISFSLFIAISPYLLHFLKIFIHKQNYRHQFNRLEKSTLKRLVEIENWIDFTRN